MVATNHNGWEVQRFDSRNGWVAVTNPFVLRFNAVDEYWLLMKLFPTNEYRVYESLK